DEGVGTVRHRHGAALHGRHAAAASLDDDARRSDLPRRCDGLHDPGVRPPDGRGEVAERSAGQRTRNAHELSGQGWPPVCRGDDPEPELALPAHRRQQRADRWRGRMGDRLRPAKGGRIGRESKRPGASLRAFSIPRKRRAYLILPSLNSTCLSTTGSYFFSTSFSVWVRWFFLVT